MAMGRRRHRLRPDVGWPLSHHRRVPFSGVTGATRRGPMLADRTEHPEPSETMPTPGASVRTRAVTRHSGGAASVGALAMGAVVLGALTAGTIAMRRTRILSDRAEHPEPSKTTPTPVAPVRTRAVSGTLAAPLHSARLLWEPWPSGPW